MGPWIKVGYEYKKQYMQNHVTKKKTAYSGYSNKMSLPGE